MCDVQPPTDEITTRQALKILGLKQPSSISRLISSEKLKPSRQLPSENGRGAYLFWRVDVERLAERRAEDRAS